MKPKPDYATGHFYAPIDIHKALQSIADERQWSLSQVIRILLTEKLTDMGLIKPTTKGQAE